jgi:hypothetical protein
VLYKDAGDEDGWQLLQARGVLGSSRRRPVVLRASGQGPIAHISGGPQGTGWWLTRHRDRVFFFCHEPRPGCRALSGVISSCRPAAHMADDLPWISYLERPGRQRARDRLWPCALHVLPCMWDGPGLNDDDSQAWTKYDIAVSTEYDGLDSWVRVYDGRGP